MNGGNKSVKNIGELSSLLDQKISTFQPNRLDIPSNQFITLLNVTKAFLEGDFTRFQRGVLFLKALLGFKAGPFMTEAWEKIEAKHAGQRTALEAESLVSDVTTDKQQLLWIEWIEKFEVIMGQFNDEVFVDDTDEGVLK